MSILSWFLHPDDLYVPTVLHVLFPEDLPVDIDYSSPDLQGIVWNADYSLDKISLGVDGILEHKKLAPVRL